ncbi:MAG: transcriptional regulator NrdR [Nanoarchaeota archaeon]|nr:transcriptional regulator NrdR [Nanoarchaeota archaeon]MBU1029988.1 transcriptional regulator NrdR [Nanoarchaeota archaeon]MBU1849240.1 transcriptional regulator NrdR [Nanoarchaeota archaeon]
MKCPFCSSSTTKVIETREGSEEINRRRRECPSCLKRFTTYERVEMNPLIIIKKDGLRESFNREKLKKGILRACEKRPITTEMINIVVDEIETELRTKKSEEVKSKNIGILVMRKLKKIDKVAYIRFASVYREFTDIDSFKEELNKLS